MVEKSLEGKREKEGSEQFIQHFSTRLAGNVQNYLFEFKRGKLTRSQINYLVSLQLKMACDRIERGKSDYRQY